MISKNSSYIVDALFLWIAIYNIFLFLNNNHVFKKIHVI